MIIPVRCFTCNAVIASKYRRYLEIISEEEGKHKDSDDESVQESVQENATQKAFQELEVKRYCCRRHLLTHIDLVDKISIKNKILVNYIIIPNGSVRNDIR